MPRTRTRNRDDDPQGGLVRVVSDDDDELEDDDDPFATDETRPGTVTPRRPNPGNGRNGNDDELRLELARLRSENARLRAVAGLEGRREEPATVGDLLDVNAVQGDLIREEVERVLDDHADALCDRIAERVEERLLETGAPEDDHGDDEETKTPSRRRGTRSNPKRKRPGRKRGNLYRDEDGAVYLWDRADEPDVVADGEFVEPA